MQPSQRPTAPRPPWQPRFGLGTLMLVMLIFSVMGSAGYYLVRSTQMGRSYQMAFIIVTLVAPLMLMIVLSNLRSLLNRRDR